MGLSEVSSIFFCPGAGLVSCLDPPAESTTTSRDDEADPEDAAPPAFPDAPEPRLAYHLLNTQGPSPRGLGFARGMVNSRARIQNAAHLLWGAIARELAGDVGKDVRELWEIVDAHWISLSENAHVEDAVIALAREIGIGAPKSAAKRVLAAVKSELLPTLHVMFGAAAKDAMHRRFHVDRAGGGPRSAFTVSAWAVLFPDCLEEAKRLPEPRGLLESLRLCRTLQHDGSAVSVAALSAKVASLATRISSTLPRLSRGEAEKRIEALEATLPFAPMDPRVRTAISALHMRVGALLCEEDQRYNDAGIHFAKAAAFDPTNQVARANIAAAKEFLATARGRLEQALRTGKQLTYKGMSLLQETRQGMGQAENLLASPWTAEQHQAYGDALLSQLAHRIGIDPAAPDAHAVACAVLGALVPGEDGGPSRAHRIGSLVQERPALASVPWKSAEKAVTNEGRIDLRELLEALPAPDVSFGDDKALRQALSALKGASAARAAASGAPPGRARVAPWLFSWQDAGTKIAVAAGIALLVTGGATYGDRLYTSHVRDRSYGALQTAVMADQRKDVLKAARRFVERTPSVAADYRGPEVARAYERALAQEIAATSAGGAGDDDLRGLLADARALHTWTGPERHGDGASSAGNGRNQ